QSLAQRGEFRMRRIIAFKHVDGIVGEHHRGQNLHRVRQMSFKADIASQAGRIDTAAIGFAGIGGDRLTGEKIHLGEGEWTRGSILSDPYRRKYVTACVEPVLVRTGDPGNEGAASLIQSVVLDPGGGI